jgi:hypothetical protein
MRPTRRAFLAWTVPLGAALLSAARPAVVTAQSVTAATAPRYFRVEAQPGTDRKGCPIVWGYVYLHSKGQGSARVRLLVESLDAAGQPVASEIAYVDNDVLLYSRTYFEMRPHTGSETFSEHVVVTETRI